MDAVSDRGPSRYAKYQVRWSYTSNKGPTFGRGFASFEDAEADYQEGIEMGMMYIDLIDCESGATILRRVTK